MKDGAGDNRGPGKPGRAAGASYTPVLGLFGPDEPRPVRTEAAEVTAEEAATRREPESRLELSVIVPARNEEANLPACLETLTAQHEAVFGLDRDWEIVIVDDDSSDRTHGIAEAVAAQYPGVRVLRSPALPPAGSEKGMTGKNNACWAGAQAAQGRWLLFTDADTRHEPGDLRRAMHEADRHAVALLSYSPRQVMTGLAQQLLMPLIFCELATSYPPAKVNDPADRTAAANGQFLLIRRETYFSVGGHKAVGHAVLEDVELARNVKRSKQDIRLRFAPDALSTQMYRTFSDMVEGWTKNLALLFPHALRLALWRLLEVLLLLLPVLLWLLPYLVMWQRVALLAVWLRVLVRFYQRVGRAHFPLLTSAVAPLGLPLFVVLLVTSFIRVRVLHRVTWKGRQYRV